MENLFKIHGSKHRRLFELIYYFIKNIPLGLVEYTILTLLFKPCFARFLKGQKFFIYVYAIASFICVFCVCMIYARKYDSIKVRALMEKYESIGKEYRNEICDFESRIQDLEYELRKEKVDFEPWDLSNTIPAKVGNKLITSSRSMDLSNYLYNGYSVIILSLFVPALHFGLREYPLFCIGVLTAVLAIFDHGLIYGYISSKELEDAIKYEEVPEIKTLNEIKKHHAKLVELIPNNKECFERFR